MDAELQFNYSANLNFFTAAFHVTLCFKAISNDDNHSCTKKCGCGWKTECQIIEGTEETLKVGKGYTKLYATVDLGDTRVGRTRRLTGQPRDPVWNESFRIYCAHTVSEVVISIKDAAIVGTIVVGRARIPAYDLISGTIILSSCLQPKLLAILSSIL